MEDLGLERLERRAAPPHAVSHFSARARMSFSLPGYHAPAIVLSNVMV